MSDPYRVRDYGTGDYPAVEAVWRAVDMATAGQGDSADVIERTLRIEHARFLLLEETAGGRIVGTSWITCDGRRLLLHHFAVEPSRQGLGLSKILLRAALEHARAAGMQMKLEVARDNTRAIELYKKGGFKSLGDYEVYILRSP